MTQCCLVGGCVRRRFPAHFVSGQASVLDEKKPKSKALNGTKPGVTSAKRR